MHRQYPLAFGPPSGHLISGSVGSSMGLLAMIDLDRMHATTHTHDLEDMGFDFVDSAQPVEVVV